MSKQNAVHLASPDTYIKYTIQMSVSPSLVYAITKKWLSGSFHFGHNVYLNISEDAIESQNHSSWHMRLMTQFYTVCQRAYIGVADCSCCYLLRCCVDDTTFMMTLWPPPKDTVMRIFNGLFIVNQDTLLDKQSSYTRFESPWCLLDVPVMILTNILSRFGAPIAHTFKLLLIIRLTPFRH